MKILLLFSVTPSSKIVTRSIEPKWKHPMLFKKPPTDATEVPPGETFTMKLGPYEFLEKNFGEVSLYYCVAL